MTKNRIKTPTVIQMEAVECGPAALKIILDYYGKFIPIEELRIECGVSRDGSKASNIVKAARRYGLQAKGYRKEPNDLKEMTLPIIAFWNFNHYLVIEGFNNGTVYLNDPATGPRKISTEEFDISFTGVVITFEPEADFQPDGEKVTMISLLRDWLRYSEWALFLITVISILVVIPGIILPNFSRIFVDRILLNTPNILPVILVSMLLTTIAYTGLFWIQRRYLLRLQTKLSISRASDFLWRIFRLPIDFFIQRYPADISARIGLTDRVARLLTEQLAVTAINLVLVVFYAAVMFAYSVVLTIAVVATALINFIILRYISRRRTDINQRLQQEQGKLVGITVNGLASIETLKSTGAEREFFQRWAGHHAKTANSFQNLGEASLLLVVVPSFLSSISTVLLVGIGGMLVIDNQLTVGSLIAYQGLMLSFMLPINQFVSLGGQVQVLDADLKRINDVMNYPMDVIYTRPTVEVEDEQPARLSGRIQLKNLTFGYNRLSAPLIRSISLTIEPGQRIALVGKSGSGKSTIAKLIAGIYHAWEGNIQFDGQEYREIAQAIIHNSLSMVDQDIMLLNGTIRDNITLWDSTIPEEDIIQATKDAQIHRDIVRRGGYNSTIDEGGRDLSGGQRQRLEIARALAINPSILILDEATSALDPATEKLIDESTRRRGATTIIVAHRLSTIRDCDEIIVLQNGSIVQRGTHDEMIKIDGVYRNLVTSEDYI